MSGAIGRRHGGSAAEPRPERPEPDGSCHERPDEPHGNNGFPLALNSARGQEMALKSQTEQIVFPTGRMQIRPAKTHH